MKRSLALAILLLTGCPTGEYLGGGAWRPIYINGSNICFTVKKEDELRRYSLAENGHNYKKLIGEEGVSLFYPNTCFTLHLEKGVIYAATYTIENTHYAYSFIIDSEGNTVDLRR